MDQNIHHVIAPHLILVNIVVQGKADVCHRTIPLRTLKRRPEEAVDGKVRHMDIDVLLDIAHVIKYEWPIQGVDIQHPHEDSQGRTEQCAPEIPRGPYRLRYCSLRT